MSTQYVRFAVTLLPPARRTGIERAESEEPLQTLAIGARQNETFEDLRKKIEARYNARAKERKTQIGQLQDSTGADIFGEDEIGSLYDGAVAGHKNAIIARLSATAPGSSDVNASDTRQLGTKRRASNEEPEVARQGPKRQRDQAGASTATHAERVDADGFKIPKSKSQTGLEATTGGSESGGIVLVKDSQPEAHEPTGSSALARLHQRRVAQSSSPAARSSPTAGVVARAVSNQQPASKPGFQRKAMPTPDSRDRLKTGDHDAPAQRTANSHRAGGWFTRHASAHSPEAPLPEEAPVQRMAPLAKKPPLPTKPSSSSNVVGGAQGSQASFGAPRERPDVNRQPHLTGEASGKLHTPSNQRSTSGPSRHSSGAKGSSKIKNTERSVAHGWTKVEDDLLLQAMSSGRGQKVEDILKKCNIDRSASAARSRIRLLEKKQRESNTMSFPSSALANPPSQSGVVPSSQMAQKSASKRLWSHGEVGTLRKAIGEGLDAREIQATYFPDRSEESVAKKKQDVQGLVLKLEKEKDTFPKDTIGDASWTDHHSLKLRRAFREGLTTPAASYRYFKGLRTTLVEQKLKAYRQQMEDSQVEKYMSQHSSPVKPKDNHQQSVGAHQQANDESEEAGRPSSQHDNQEAADAGPQPSQDEIDAEILRELATLESPDRDTGDDTLVVQDSYETASVAAFNSSPPLLRKNAPRTGSPLVVIPPAEQRHVQRARREAVDRPTARQSQLLRNGSSNGQTQLNFRRDKGKGAVRPAVDIQVLDREYTRTSSRPQEGRSEQLVEQEVVEISSGEEKEEDALLEASRLPTMPQLDGPNSQEEQPAQHMPSDGAQSDGNGTVSSDGPNRQLAFELEQSMSAAELSPQSQLPLPPHTQLSVSAGALSTQSQLPMPPQSREPSRSASTAMESRPTAYVHIPGPPRATNTSRAQKTQWQESDNESDGDYVESLTATVKQPRKRKAATQRTTPPTASRQRSKPISISSEDESPAFQTQDPTTTLSQKQKLSKAQKLEPARKSTSLLHDAIVSGGAPPPSATASQHDSNKSAQPEPVVPKRRRDIYDVPVKSQSTAGTKNQRKKDGHVSNSAKKTEPPATSSSIFSEPRGPGKLPRIYGRASKMQQARREADAKIAARRVEREARALAASSSAAEPTQADAEVEETSQPPVSAAPEEEDVEEIPRNDLPGLAHPTSAGLPNEALPKTSSPDKPVTNSLTPDHSRTPQTVVDELPNHCANAEASHDTAVYSQSQVAPEPVVELPYPQILSREPGPNGKVEVGRPGLSWLAPADWQHLRSDEEIYAAVAKGRSDPRQIRRLCQDEKLSDQQQVAMICSDQEKLRQLHKLERRYRRERRIEDGLPPSRGPARSPFWRPGMPKPISWDVNIMPDSDDSMSSKFRDGADGDEATDEEGEVSEAESDDDDDDPAYFERSRHFSEVEDESEEEQDARSEMLTIKPNEVKSRHVPSDLAGRSPERDDVSVKEASHSAQKQPPSKQEDPPVVDTLTESSSATQQSDVTQHQIRSNTRERSAERVEATVHESEEPEEAVEEASDVIDVLGGHAVDEDQDDEDAELPTAPPTAHDDIDGDPVAAPSDAQLQDLVQSGDVEMEDDREESATASQTRLSPSLGAASDEHSPDKKLSAMSFDRHTTSNERTAHGGTQVTESILPPWPSSGKVRSSSPEASPKPSSASVHETAMAPQKQQQTEPSSKKRKRDDEPDDHAARKAARKERKRQQRAERSTEDSPPADKEQPRDTEGVNGHSGVDASVTALVPPVEETTGKETRMKPKKSKKNKKKREQDAAATGKANEVPHQAKPAQADDRATMPAPALPRQQSLAMQQSSLPSPDSELSTTAARKQARRARKKAKRAERAERRRSNVNVSTNDGMTSGTPVSFAVASSSPAPAVVAAPVRIEPAAQQPLPVDENQGVSALPTGNKTPSAKKPSPTVAEPQAVVHDNSSEVSQPAAAQPSPAHSGQQANFKDPDKKKKKKKKSKSVSQSGRPSQQLPPAAESKGVAQSIEQPEPKPRAQASPQANPESNNPQIPKTNPTQPSHATNPKKITKPAPKPNKAAPGASTAAYGLMGFQAHIPAPPKVRPQAAEKVVGKPAFFAEGEEEDDEESEESSGSG